MPLRRPLLLVMLALAAVVGRAQAQSTALVVEPSEVAVTVPQGEEVVRVVTLTNTGNETLSFCLSFERPLQREGSALRLSTEARAVGGAPCGDYGEVLHRLRDEDVEVSGWLPFGLAMTPEGRLFSSSTSGLHRTFEFTPTLEYVRYFEHPFLEELSPFGSTWGIAYDDVSGTLWWINEESYGHDNLLRNLLLEGDLDGNATGRRIELPIEHQGEAAYALGPSYDPATDRFYYTDVVADLIWAVDREGVVPVGYPLEQTAYPGGGTGRGVDAHGGADGGAEGVRLEAAIQTPPANDFDRVVVLDPWGEGLGEALETPVPAEILSPSFSGVRANPLRSRVDPNGVMYMTYLGFDDNGVIAVRPHPLPPSWLHVDSDEGPDAAWGGTFAPGESREVTLTFRVGAREVGTYTSALQAFDAATGEAVEVPLTLEVTQGTPAEDAPIAVSAKPWQLLAPYPNPSEGTVTVPLEVVRAAEVRVTVLDVLGREVAVLHEGWLHAGQHRLTLRERLPAGLYVVRPTGAGLHASERIVIQ